MMFDILTLVAATGRERTTGEYADCLVDTGWAYADTRYPEHELMGADEPVTD